ncbi:FUSC family protein [Luteimonas sp. 100069]|uniref:FUSC family protein n=1 Tax=Luteimonas sp. 100069 TaxID=2006109 RepID=UPI000F50B4E5|nr:FUSC family protein [Luteimonas sp. 100069]RPD83654.1 FUSC family protein [Luteimonas sp. 100069]
MNPPPGTTSAARIRRRDAMRQLLQGYHLRDSVSLAPRAPIGDALAAGTQAAVAALIVLPLALLSPWPHLIGFASLGALVALFARFAPAAQRRAQMLRVALLQVGSVAAMSMAAWLGLGLELQLLVLALLCGVFFLACEAGRFGAPGPLIFVFAASASMSPALSTTQLLERIAVTAVAALVAWLVCALSDPARRRRLTMASPAPGAPAQWRFVLGRIIVGTAAAAFVTHAAGAAYPGWAAMGALAVLQATRLHFGLQRALQRVVGTAIGALLVGCLLAMQPSAWTIIGVLALIQVATELVIGRNYAIGQVLVTPMALLMTALAAPTAAGSGMVAERVVDTIAGAVIGLTVLVLLSSERDRLHLQLHHSEQTSGRH